MKRIAAFFISFVLILSMFSGMAFADEQPDADPAIEVEAEGIVPEAADVIAPEVADIIIPEEPGEDIYDSAPILYETESISSDLEGADDIAPENLEGADDITPEDPEDISDNDELLMEYMELSVSDSSEPTYSVFGLNHLTGINIKVYGLIKDCVSKVASGEESSTVFTFYMSDLGLDGRYSAADLGVSAVVSNGAVTSEAKAAMKAKLQEINLSRVNSALLFDCPAEFYWYEKSVGCSMRSSIGMGATYDYSRGEYLMYFSDATMVQFSYTVAEDYAVNHASGTYVVDTSVTTSIQTAIDHANEIITDHANEADYQKLVSYKDEICNAVKYNTAAGNNNYTYNYGNPWQLIWVFDNDTSTDVVCEGYAKAFQFLCDGSKFRSHLVASRIVTGTMAGGTGAGGHMWNVVTMNDGKNYLVDVTNCDGGTIGYPNKLFLVGYGSGSATAGYSIPISGQSTMTFTYDDNTRANYSVEELTLSSKAYDPSYTPVESFTITFEDADGTVLLERTYEYGTSAAAIVRPADPEKDPDAEGHYVFTGWTPEIEDVSDDAVYTAEYVLQQHQPDEPVIKNRVEATCEDAGSYDAVTYCSVCDKEIGSETITIPATGHAWGEWYVIEAATEETEGLEGRDCGNDHSHTETRGIPKLAHKHNLQKTDAKAATCTTEGNSAYWTCTGCGEYFSDAAGTVEIEKDSWIIPKKEHTAVTIPGQDATCTESGLTDGSKCSVCGEILHAQEIIPATGHNYSDWVVTKAATCTENGSHEKVCANCGNKVTETIHAKGHAWDEDYTVDQAATCTEAGSESIRCIVCGLIKETTVRTIPATGHSYGDWAVAKEATCTEAGSREMVCSICGDKVTEVIPATGHDWGEWYEITPATDDIDGLEGRDCSNDPTHQETRVIPKLNHKHVMQKTAAKEATCTAEGNSAYWTCTECREYFADEAGTEEIEKDSWIIPKKAHTAVTIPGKAATCTESGLTDGSKCSVCGEILKAQEIIPAAGHHFDEWIITKEATCTEDGTMEKDCEVCGAKEIETIFAPGHKWSHEYTVDKEATCTETGSESIHCLACGASDETTVRGIPAKGHSYGEWVVTKEATCTEAGSHEKVCSACGDKVTETLHAKGHTYGDWVVTKEATYDEEGYREKVCSVCGDKITGTIPKLIPTDGWVTISGKQYFYVNGTAKTKWHSENGKWYYLNPDDGGAMVTGLRKVGGAYYYMDKDGVMKTGWINDDGTWYYAQSSGALLTGWLQSGSTWYYMDPTTCKMATGWVKVGNTWYYMNPSGAMATGWVKDGDTWYYMAASGAMTTGWVKVGSSWYYMKPSGAMASSEWYGGYWLNANGTWTYQPRGSWKSNSIGWWFGDTSGWYAKNEKVTIDGVEYTFDARGYWVQ